MKSVLYKLCIRGEKVEVLGLGNSHVIFFFFSSSTEWKYDFIL